MVSAKIKNQAELARHLGLTKGSMTLWFNGTTNPANVPSTTALRAERVLGVPWEWLVSGRGQPTPNNRSVASSGYTDEEGNHVTVTVRPGVGEARAEYSPKAAAEHRKLITSIVNELLQLDADRLRGLLHFLRAGG